VPGSTLACSRVMWAKVAPAHADIAQAAINLIVNDMM
jgi:hypothetical protein